MYGNIRTKNQRPTVRRAKNTRSNPKIQRRGTQLTKNKVQQQDLEATKEKEHQHDRLMTEETKKYGKPLKDKIYRKVLKKGKKEHKNVQTHYKGRNGLPGRNLRLHGGLYLP